LVCGVNNCITLVGSRESFIAEKGLLPVGKN
jgi:hypothetical protein